MKAQPTIIKHIFSRNSRYTTALTNALGEEEEDVKVSDVLHSCLRVNHVLHEFGLALRQLEAMPNSIQAARAVLPVGRRDDHLESAQKSVSVRQIKCQCTIIHPGCLFA